LAANLPFFRAEDAFVPPEFTSTRSADPGLEFNVLVIVVLLVVLNLLLSRG
jgi:hypothetical protein